MIQTRTQQRRIIEAATLDGSLDTLYWYPVSDRGGGRTEAVGVNEQIPIVRVAPDPEITQHDAHIMLELFKQKSPELLLHLELTAIDILEEGGFKYFEFGTSDLICPMCAAVGWESCICQPTLWRIEEPVETTKNQERERITL
ncbi:MAG: hypothetical protein IT328_04465 [Caldilineaceae bacterium]|nr:hypothetical protein [Caldilineaceae bacterium]